MLAVNYQWELPFGKGRRWMNRGGVANHVLGGWVLNGITSLQSGSPISLGTRNNTSGSYGGGQRPESTGIKSQTEGGTADRIYGWFNPAAFVEPAPFTFGSVGRFLPDNLGPPLANWDVSILKDLSVTERFRLQFRTELFNALNNVNFANPSGTTLGQPGADYRGGAGAHHSIRLEALLLSARAYSAAAGALETAVEAVGHGRWRAAQVRCPAPPAALPAVRKPDLTSSGVVPLAPLPGIDPEGRRSAATRDNRRRARAGRRIRGPIEIRSTARRPGR